MNNFTSKAQSAVLDLAMDYVLKDPAHNLPRLLEVAENFSGADSLRPGVMKNGAPTKPWFCGEGCTPAPLATQSFNWRGNAPLL